MLGTVMNLLVAEIYFRTPCFGDKMKEWHVALHHNDVNDRIAYADFISRDEAYEWALSKCKKRNYIFFEDECKSHEENHNVTFTCAHCGQEIDKFISGEVAHLDEKMYPVCNRCMRKFLRMEK